MNNSQKGASLLIIFFIMTIILVMVLIISAILISRIWIITSVGSHASLLSAADKGIEYGLKFLKDNPQQTGAFSYTFTTVDGLTVEATVSAGVGGSRTITVVSSNPNGDKRAFQAVRTIDSQQVSFYYGLHTDEGGVVMGNNAILNGNAFSNGNIIGSNGSRITGTVRVAGIGKKLSNVDVGTVAVATDAYVDICENDGTVISGVLHANAPGDCDYASWTTSDLPVDPVALPLADSQIQQWRDEAALGGTFEGDKNIAGTESLGPKKINGNLNINGTLVVTGTLWVTGQIATSTGAIIRLDTGYGANSGIIIGDGLTIPSISISNNTTISGSGEVGSYLMVVGGKNAPTEQVIDAGNNSSGAIYYANHGRIHLRNNARAKEVTAYGLDIEPSATVDYESGLADTRFVNGPSGGWKVEWKEISPSSGGLIIDAAPAPI